MKVSAQNIESGKEFQIESSSVDDVFVEAKRSRGQPA